MIVQITLYRSFVHYIVIGDIFYQSHFRAGYDRLIMYGNRTNLALDLKLSATPH